MKTLCKHVKGTRETAFLVVYLLALTSMLMAVFSLGVDWLTFLYFDNLPGWRPPIHPMTFYLLGAAILLAGIVWVCEAVGGQEKTKQEPKRPLIYPLYAFFVVWFGAGMWAMKGDMEQFRRLQEALILRASGLTFAEPHPFGVWAGLAILIFVLAGTLLVFFWGMQRFFHLLFKEKEQ